MSTTTKATKGTDTPASKTTDGQAGTEPVKEDVPLSFPPPIEKLKGTNMEAVARNWANLREREEVTICSEAKCYYPLNPHRTDEGGQQVTVEETERGPAIVGVCSWDPRHGGGKQFIYPKKKKDDDDPLNLKR